MAKMDKQVIASAKAAQAAVKSGVWDKVLGGGASSSKAPAKRGGGGKGQSDLLGMSPAAAVAKVIKEAEARAAAAAAVAPPAKVDRVTRAQAAAPTTTTTTTTGKGLKAAQRAAKAPGKPVQVVATAPKAVDPIEDMPATARRSQFNGKRIVVADGDLYTGRRFRKGTLRAALLEAIIASKTVDAVLGTTVKADNGKSRTVESIDIAFAVEVGCITLV